MTQPDPDAKCATCVWFAEVSWYAESNPNLIPNGFCRRKAPNPTLATVHAQFGCGDHQEKEKNQWENS